MVCKEDVVSWFKELESYKRIDTMCSLLNMCLPFELRFIGTCLEELGSRDSSQLRGIELRVNNSTELANEVAAFQLGDPSDIKVRRKMALYLALIRACNRHCVNELFSTLNSWSNSEFLKIADDDALQELLLVYTMAANHPVFSFEQRMKCGEMYNKIKYSHVDFMVYAEASAPLQMDKSVTASPMNYRNPNEMSTLQNVLITQKPDGHQTIITNVTPMMTTQIPGTQLTYEQNPMSQVVHHDVNLSPHFIDSVPQMFPSNVNISQVCQNPSPSTSAPYTVRHNVAHSRYPTHLSDQSESPSQPSSPIESRSSSPKVHLQSNRQSSHKIESRSSSFETMPSSSSSQHLQYNDFEKNDMSSSQNSKLNNEMNINENDPTSQVRPVSIYYSRNGFIRPGPQRQLTKPNIQHHMQNALSQQQQQQQLQNQQLIQQHANQIAGANPNGILYSMQNLNFLDNNVVILNNDGIPIMHKSESDSASSGESIDDTTPPDTPLTQAHSSSNSGSNKHFKLRDQQSMMSRHRVMTSTPPMIYNQLQPQSHTVISSIAQAQQIPVVQADIMLSPTISPQQHQQQQHQLQQQQQQQQSTMNLNLTNMTGSNTSNNNLVTSTVLITNKPGQNITTMPSFSIGGNPPVLFQQYPPPPHHIQQGPQSQLNTTYHYHTQHIPINSRGSILTAPNTTSPGSQPTTYRLPPYHVQPNGDVLYPFPSTITYIQPTAIPLSRPSNHPQTHPIVPQPTHSNVQQQVKSLTAYQTVPEVKANVSCFNCGSPFHTGRECQEASMEDVTRGTVYKLDYNSPADVENSGSAGEVSTTEPTLLQTSVINK